MEGLKGNQAHDGSGTVELSAVLLEYDVIYYTLH